MKHLFHKACVRDGWLCLQVENRLMARQEVAQMRPDVTYEVEVKRHRKARSLDANALYWKLCGELSSVMGEPPEVIYKRHIHDMGNYETYAMKSKAVRAFNRMWTDGHLGRFIQTRKSTVPGFTTVLAYYGSSDFDTAQMSHLIDSCVQDCQSVGIETLPPNEIERLKGEWNAGGVERRSRD